MNFLNYIAPSAMVAFTLSPSASIQAQNNISIPINISFGEYCEVLETPSAISLTASRGENLHYDFGISWRCVGGTGKQVGISFMPITLPNGSEVVITRRGEQATGVYIPSSGGRAFSMSVIAKRTSITTSFCFLMFL